MLTTKLRFASKRPLKTITMTISDGFGPFSDDFGRFQIVSDGFGRFRTVSDRFQNVSDRFRTVSDRFPTVSDDSSLIFKISNFNWPGLGPEPSRPPRAVRPAPALAN